MGNDLIALDRKARRELEQLLTDGNTAQKIAKRARIVLMTADGHGVVAIVKRWLTRHKRFTLHFTPTSCSWLNLVERLFAEITRQRIRRGTFNDVIELKTAIDEWIEHRNQNPKPFKWTASAKSTRKAPPSQKGARHRKSGMQMNESEH